MIPDQQVPVERRGAIDVARSASLILVVVAHLVMVVLDRDPEGGLRGVNLFELYPNFEWLTMVSPMPLFFVASGWANVGSSTGSRLRRLRTMMTLATVLAVCWSVATVVEYAVSGGNGIVADGARIATQPLWFLAAWIPFTMAAPFIDRCARRAFPVIGACLGLVALVDVARFGLGAPRWVGFPGFFIVWVIPWMMGSWWRQRHDEPRPVDEFRVGLAVATAALVAVAILAVFFEYHVALIDAVPGNRSNTTPPTLFTAVAALVQVGLFMMGARRLDGIAIRRAGGIRTLNQFAPGLYVWHLTSLTLWAALLAAGLWAPERLTAQWWISRPVWFALVVAGALGFSLASRSLLVRMIGSSTAGVSVRSSDVAVLVLATVAASVAFAMTGLWGPDTTGMAVSISVLCLVALSGYGLVTRPRERDRVTAS